jgi:hypothetical protein
MATSPEPEPPRKYFDDPDVLAIDSGLIIA